jgi:hypothetical protein
LFPDYPSPRSYPEASPKISVNPFASALPDIVESNHWRDLNWLGMLRLILGRAAFRSHV